MKRFILFAVSLLMMTNAFGQSTLTPTFQWQGMVRDAQGNLFKNKTIGIKFILSQNNTTVYEETHTNKTTSAAGMLSLPVGGGTPTTSAKIADIDWTAADTYISIELDTNNSNTFLSMGTTKLLFVPLAVFANTADTVLNMPDNSKMNELIDNMTFDSTTSILRIVEGGHTFEVNLGLLSNPDKLTVGKADTTLTGDAGQTTVLSGLPQNVYDVYQSFKPINSGLLSEIAINFGANNSFELKIYEGDGIGGTLLYTKNFSAIASGSNTLILNNPIEVTATNFYTFELSIVSPSTSNYLTVSYGDNNPYPDGLSNFPVGTDPDLVFEVFVDVVSPAPMQVTDKGTEFSPKVVITAQTYNQGKIPLLVKNEIGDSTFRVYDNKKVVVDGSFRVVSDGYENVLLGKNYKDESYVKLSSYDISSYLDFINSKTDERWHLTGPRNYEPNDPFSIFWYDGTIHHRYLNILNNGNFEIFNSLRVGNNNNENISFGKNYKNESYVKISSYDVSSYLDFINSKTDERWHLTGPRNYESGNPFSIFWFNGTTHIRYFSILDNGQIGIGTNTPQEKLHVNGKIKANNFIVFSDRRYKTNIQPISNALGKILQIEGVYHDWKIDEFPDYEFSKERQVAFIAQELEKQFPELVITDQNGYKAVAYSKVTPVLVEAIKEQQTQIETLKAEKQQQTDQVAALAKQVALLAQQVQALQQNEASVSNK